MRCTALRVLPTSSAESWKYLFQKHLRSVPRPLAAAQAAEGKSNVLLPDRSVHHRPEELLGQAMSCKIQQKKTQKWSQFTSPRIRDLDNPQDYKASTWCQIYKIQSRASQKIRTVIRFTESHTRSEFDIEIKLPPKVLPHEVAGQLCREPWAHEDDFFWTVFKFSN